MPVNCEGRKQGLKEDTHGVGGLSADAGTTVLLPGLAMSCGGWGVGAGHLCVWPLCLGPGLP